MLNQWIIYDGNCGLCLNSKKALVRLGVIKEQDCLNYHTLNESLYAQIDPAHFKYEMAMIDKENHKANYGLEAVLFIFGEKLRFLKSVKKQSLFFQILEFFYHAISFNRYVLFPRKRKFQCDCEPPFSSKYFTRWLGLCVLLSVVFSFALGYEIGYLQDYNPALRGAQVTAVVGLGWCFQITLAIMLMRFELLKDYLRHLSFIMVVGVFVLLPSLLLFWLPAPFNVIVVSLNIAFSSLYMLRMHYLRARFLGVSQLWTVSWLLCLQLGACFLVNYFQIFSL